MRSYEVEISRTAERQLRQLPTQDQLRIARAIVALGQEPFPRGVRKLTGYDDVYRLRVGRYRVLSSVEESRLVIIILKVGHRKDVYR